MSHSKKLALICGAAVIVTALALVFAAGAAHGSAEPAVRGHACTHVGEHRKNRAGTEYVCEQRTGDDCPRWHAARPVKGIWPKPSPCLCPSRATSPKPSPSSRSTSAAASPTPPARPVPAVDILPVTGLPLTVKAIAAAGGLLILAGAALLIVPFRRNP